MFTYWYAKIQYVTVRTYRLKIECVRYVSSSLETSYIIKDRLPYLMSAPQHHLYNGLARPVDYSILHGKWNALARQRVVLAYGQRGSLWVRDKRLDGQRDNRTDYEKTMS